MDHGLQEGFDRALRDEEGPARSGSNPDASPHCAQCCCSQSTTGPFTAAPPTLAAPDAEPLRAEIADTSALTSPTVLILGAGAIAEFILPWALIGLSDLFLFDTPTWSMWAAFASPPAITLAALVTRLILKGRTRDH